MEWRLGIGDNFSNAIGTSNKILGSPNFISILENMYLDIHSHRFSTGPSEAHTRIGSDGKPYVAGDQVAPHNATTKRFIYYVGDSGTSQVGTLYRFGKDVINPKGIRVQGYDDFKDGNKLYDRLIRTAK